MPLRTVVLRNWLPGLLAVLSLLMPAFTNAQNCGGTSVGSPELSHIINPPCLPNFRTPAANYVSAMYQFEAQAIVDFLNVHNQPSDSASVSAFLNMATKDTRDEVRAFMLTELTAIISNPALRPAGSWQNDLFNFITIFVQQVELTTYTLAYNEYQKFLDDPCTYVPDSELSAQFSIPQSTVNCNFLAQLFSTPSQPPAAYFVALGARQAYGSLLDQSTAMVSTYRVISNLQQSSLSQVALISALAPGAVTAAAVIQNFAEIAPFAVRTFFVPAIQAATDGAADAAEAGFVAADAGAGAFAIVTTAVLILVEGSIDFSESVATQNGLNAMVAQYHNLMTPGYTLDLAALVADSSQVYKLTSVWTFLTANNIEAAAPSYRPNVDPVVGVTPVTLSNSSALFGNAPNDLNDYPSSFVAQGPQEFQNSFTNVDFEGRTWQVQLYGSTYFIKTCLAAGTVISPNTGHTISFPCYGPELATTLETTLPASQSGTSSGPWTTNTEQAIVSRTGGEFTVVDVVAASNGVPVCQSEFGSGPSSFPYAVGSCGSFVSSFGFFPQPYSGSTLGSTVSDPGVLPYSKVVISNVPVFTSNSIISLLPGQISTFPITATAGGQPVTVTAGPCAGSTTPNPPLPAGLLFEPGLAPSIVAYGNTPAGTYSFTVCGEVPPSGAVTSQQLTISVATVPVFTTTTTFTPGDSVPFSYTVAASGSPTPAITFQNISYNILQQVTFTDNGNGTATVAGSISGSTTYICFSNCPVITGPPTVTATSGTNATTVPFNLNAMATPTPVLNVPSQFNMTAGVPNSFKISATEPVTVPALYSDATNAVLVQSFGVAVHNPSVTTPLSNASWLHFQDNGDGTATIFGTPPEDTVESLGLEVQAMSSGSLAVAAFTTINVSAPPQFVNDPSYAIFRVGLNGVLHLNTVNRPTATTNLSALPGTPQFLVDGPDATQLNLNPPAGSGGHYTVPVKLTNASGAANQSFDIYITEPVTLTLNSPGNAKTFQIHQGVSYNLAVLAAGYPLVKPAANAPAALGSGLNLVTTTLDIPGSFTSTATGGNLLLQPSTATRPARSILSVTANNGIGPPQSLQIQFAVVKAGDTNGDGLLTCADLTLVKNALNTSVGQPNYNINADVNLDGLVNNKDYSFVSSKLPLETVCQ